MDHMRDAQEERTEVLRLVEEATSQQNNPEALIRLLGRLVGDTSSVAVMAAHGTTHLARIADALENIEKSLTALTQR